MENLVLVSPSDLTSIIEASIQKALQGMKPEQTIIQNQTEKLLSVSDLVKMFGVSKVTIHTWKRQGKLPYIKVQRRVFFRQNEIEEFLNEYRNDHKH